MVYKDFVTSFIRHWNFTRSETLEILGSLDDEKLQFKPKGEKWQALFWEFGCIGRTQLVYTEAIKTGKMDFSLFESPKLSPKDEFKTKADILKSLEKINKEWREAIVNRRGDEDFKIAWPGFKMSLPVHISSLVAHERLHHGQFISYFTLAGFELPKGFKTNWAL